MAATQLADIIEPSVFNPYVIEKSLETNVLYQSGILASHPTITKLAQSGGSIIDIPFWNDLADTEANISSDNPASKSVPGKIGTGRDRAAQHFRNNSWSAMDLTAAIAGEDPMRRIGDLVAGYWQRQMQRTLIASMNGLVADNVATNAGDMVVNIATDALGTPTSAELISGSAVIDAMQTMGDASANLSMIAMHSVIYARLLKQNLIATEKTSDGKSTIQRYLDKRVIVDDTLPAAAGANRITYTTFLLGQGAFAYADGNPKVPHETKRDADAGDGGGQDTLFSRKDFVLHPRGVKFNSTTVVGKSPTNAELALAANWTRVVDRKKIRMVALKTNG